MAEDKVPQESRPIQKMSRRQFGGVVAGVAAKTALVTTGLGVAATGLSVAVSREPSATKPSEAKEESEKPINPLEVVNALEQLQSEVFEKDTNRPLWEIGKSVGDKKRVMDFASILEKSDPETLQNARVEMGDSNDPNQATNKARLAHAFLGSKVWNAGTTKSNNPSDRLKGSDIFNDISLSEVGNNQSGYFVNVSVSTNVTEGAELNITADFNVNFNGEGYGDKSELLVTNPAGEQYTLVRIRSSEKGTIYRKTQGQTILGQEEYDQNGNISSQMNEEQLKEEFNNTYNIFKSNLEESLQP